MSIKTLDATEQTWSTSIITSNTVSMKHLVEAVPSHMQKKKLEVFIYFTQLY
jgi:hypothetical protein